LYESRGTQPQTFWTAISMTAHSAAGTFFAKMHGDQPGRIETKIRT
jgi:hypothetical protein